MERRPALHCVESASSFQSIDIFGKKILESLMCYLLHDKFLSWKYQNPTINIGLPRWHYW